MVSKRVVYHGRVQGVGFRYTAQQLASNLHVTGFVRNLPDGTVELVAEGDKLAVESLLERVAARMGDLIAQAVVEEKPAHGSRGFTIRH